MRTESLRNHALVAALLIALAPAFSGCLNLKPVADTGRYFLLTPLSGAPSALCARPAVGIGRVEIPDYLRSKGIALRKSTNEIQYSDTLRWAEPLDKGIQRVIGANLSSLLGATNVSLSLWRRSDVQVEVYVAVLRLESDEHGQAVLEARWRVTRPGADIVLRAETSRITRQGPSFAENPDGATATLSQAIADLSHEIAEAVHALGPSSSGL